MAVGRVSKRHPIAVIPPVAGLLASGRPDRTGAVAGGQDLVGNHRCASGRRPEVTGRLAARTVFEQPVASDEAFHPDGGRLFIPPDARLDSRADKEPPPRRCSATTPPKDLKNPADECPVLPPPDHRLVFDADSSYGEVSGRY